MRIFTTGCYVTTRKVGEGMGLGLAISKKILLDHGGDLELVETSAAGTTFRIIVPHPPAPSPGPHEHTHPGRGGDLHKDSPSPGGRVGMGEGARG